MTIGAGLWAADPHEYGPGKIHVVDADNGEKTLCGKWLRAVPGQLLARGRATCKICLNAIENRAHRKAMQEEWRKDSLRREVERNAQSLERQQRYSVYLQSPEWRERRQAVMRRAGGTCEGCGTARATQVHHVTYEHIFDELLWELRAVCDHCHDRIHSSRDEGAR